MDVELRHNPISDEEREKLRKMFPVGKVEMTREQSCRQSEIVNEAYKLSLKLTEFLPAGRERAMAITDLDNLVQHARAAIERE